MTTTQQPLHSGFSPWSTSVDVIKGINLVGKVAIVTGGYAGLGLETARTLASAGARVIVPARDMAKARDNIAAIGGGIELAPMDLCDPASINRFAQTFEQSGLALHILVNSAGIMALPTLNRDSRGYELQFSTNHLGHFQLTAALWPALKRAQGARVIAVSSMGHRFSDINFDDIHFSRRPYDPWVAYGQSKTANALFAKALDQRGQPFGIRAFSVHPGGIITGLAKHMDPERIKAMGFIDAQGNPVINPKLDMKSVPQGAATQIWCAVSPLLQDKGGVYCLDSDIAPLLKAEAKSSVDDFASQSRADRAMGVEPYAVDPQNAERLWACSEALTGSALHD